FMAPPARTAAFSSTRCPGMVLRVSSRRNWVPASASTHCRVKVAMPQRRCRKFSAVRSAVRMARTGPRTSPKTWPASTTLPSSTKKRTSQRGSTLRKVRRAGSNPATTIHCLHRKVARPIWSEGTSASVVRSPGPTSSASASSISRSRRSISALRRKHGDVLPDPLQPALLLGGKRPVLFHHLGGRPGEEALVGETRLQLRELGGELLLLLAQLGHELLAVDDVLQRDAEFDPLHETGGAPLGPGLRPRRGAPHLRQPAEPEDPVAQPGGGLLVRVEEHLDL